MPSLKAVTRLSLTYGFPSTSSGRAQKDLHVLCKYPINPTPKSQSLLFERNADGIKEGAGFLWVFSSGNNGD